MLVFAIILLAILQKSKDEYSVILNSRSLTLEDSPLSNYLQKRKIFYSLKMKNEVIKEPEWEVVDPNPPSIFVYDDSEEDLDTKIEEIDKLIVLRNHLDRNTFNIDEMNLLEKDASNLVDEIKSLLVQAKSSNLGFGILKLSLQIEEKRNTLKALKSKIANQQLMLEQLYYVIEKLSKQLESINTELDVYIFQAKRRDS